MKKCRYIPQAELQPLVNDDQMGILRRAFDEGRIRLGNKAKRQLTGIWHIKLDVYLNAIRDHFQNKYRVFKKREKLSNRLLPNKFEASIWMREPDDDNDYDDGTIYVEFTVLEDHSVLICDTHEHEDLGRGMRLPQ